MGDDVAAVAVVADAIVFNTAAAPAIAVAAGEAVAADEAVAVLFTATARRS